MEQVGKRGQTPMAARGPKGASHYWCLTPFPAGSEMPASGVLDDLTSPTAYNPISETFPANKTSPAQPGALHVRRTDAPIKCTERSGFSFSLPL